MSVIFKLVLSAISLIPLINGIDGNTKFIGMAILLCGFIASKDD